MVRKKERNLTRKKEKKSYLPYLFVATLLLDQVTKVLIRKGIALGERLTTIPHVLWLTHVENTGASFSMLTGNNLLLIFVALIVLGLLIYNYDSFKGMWEKRAYALITAGLLGNLLDRILFGAVTDFLDLGWWPVFNVADSALVIGVLGLIVFELRNQLNRKKQRKEAYSPQP